jgi:hypothetical protein
MEPHTGKSKQNVIEATVVTDPTVTHSLSRRRCLLGIDRISADSTAHDILGRFTCRCSTAT